MIVSLSLKYDQTTTRKDMGGIARPRELPGHGIAWPRESPGKANRQSPGLNNRQEKRSARENAKRRGNAKRRRNAKEKRTHFGLIYGASDSVGNHVGMSGRRGSISSWGTRLLPGCFRRLGPVSPSFCTNSFSLQSLTL